MHARTPRGPSTSFAIWAAGSIRRSCAKVASRRRSADSSSTARLSVVLSISDARFPSEIEAGIYFLCAEGLANASKHASASTVEVSVRQADAAVIVELRDDGVGGADLDRGSGLRGLADRIEALGGRLTVESPTERGTRLIAVLPLVGEA